MMCYYEMLIHKLCHSICELKLFIYRMLIGDSLITELNGQNHCIKQYVDSKCVEQGVKVKSAEFYISSGLRSSPKKCLLNVYAANILEGPLDDTDVIQCLFPLQISSITLDELTTKFIDDHSVFADMIEFQNPSMAIYRDGQPLEIAWIARIELFNPMHAYDYEVHVSLK